MSNVKQNQTERIYDDINGFELRFGKFCNPHEWIQGIQEKFEIRILHQDSEIISILNQKIKEMLQDI